MNLTLRSDLVAIKIDPEEAYYGAILLPTKAREKPMTGTVMSVGPGRYLDNGKIAPMECEVGDHVHWISEWMGEPVQVDGEEYYIIHDDEILMVDS